MDNHRQSSAELSYSVNLSQQVWRNPVYFIAFGFGSGLIPFAPGTWGTLAAIPLYLLLAKCPLSFYLLLVLIAFLFGVWISHKISQELATHDYAGIVWDEIVGYLITMIAVPMQLTWIIIAFLLFRLFDIWKPQPIRFIDRHIKGGLGIMLDDVIAAVFAWLVLQLLIWGFTS